MTQETSQAREDDRPSLPKALWRYVDADYVTAYKARFIYYFSFGCIGVVLVAMAYTLAIQLNDPLQSSPNVSILLAELTGGGLFGVVLALLVRGHFSLAAHSLLLVALASIWTVIFQDRGQPLAKLDTIVFAFAVSLIAVFEGYDAKPTAEGVSAATTRTVVTSALTILALDFVLTVFMFRGGIN